MPKVPSPAGVPALAGVLPGKSLMEMAAKGKPLFLYCAVMHV